MRTPIVAFLPVSLVLALACTSGELRVGTDVSTDAGRDARDTAATDLATLPNLDTADLDTDDLDTLQDSGSASDSVSDHAHDTLGAEEQPPETVAPPERLCQPCLGDVECATPDEPVARCLSYGAEGSFCGVPCVTSADCPEGYACDPSASGLDGAGQCRWAFGVCPCGAWGFATGASTSCFVTGSTGTCTGVRRCNEQGLTPCDARTPALELCNLVDDDCDGETDEELASQPCENANLWGTCAGTTACTQGVPTCEGPTPAKETCDLADNDCDGQTDDGYPDTDGDNVPDCQAVDDDGDGVVDVLDNCPALPNPGQVDADGDGKGDACDPDDDEDGVLDTDDCLPNDASAYPGALELCNGRDDDCDGLVDENFLNTDDDPLADCVDPDVDNDSVLNGLDNCPLVFNPQQVETDGDHEGDACDPDDDDDDVLDTADNCPLVANTDQRDTDDDATGDACDDDDDDDGVSDDDDVCPLIVDPAQADLDDDGLGDACDDSDGDGFVDAIDNCPFVGNPFQENNEGDLVGDLCDADDDNDGVTDDVDLCPYAYDPLQADFDLDGVGDACDDSDGDGVNDDLDDCVELPNPLQENFDGDAHGDVCDADDDNDGDPDETDCAPRDPVRYTNAIEVCDGVDNDCNQVVDDGWNDTDGDQAADCVDPDDDDDGVADGLDNCRLLANPDQADLDGDTQGDACDPDDDNDGLLDGADNCPATFDPSGLDTDGDKLGDVCDDDDDGDDVLDNGDNCPLIANPDQADLDTDDEGDACDDSDGDGIVDLLDVCPLVPDPQQIDTDGDHLGDACDDDDDGDGDPDDDDCLSLVASAYHGADEACNGVDDDCDDATDEGFPDYDADTLRDCVDPDDDDDGVSDVDDNCPLLSNSDQADFEHDGQGDNCDEDDDNDGDPDVSDCVPYDAAIGHGLTEVCNGHDDNCDSVVDEGFLDFDKDSLANCVDPDDDDDDVPDTTDNCPWTENPTQADFDGDGNGDGCDDDDDDDGDADAADCDPFNASVGPGKQEDCNELDDDCDGWIDEGEGGANCTVYYQDIDKDGFGDATYSKCICRPTGAYNVQTAGDCCDVSSDSYPGQTSFFSGPNNCDNFDYNCNHTEEKLLQQHGVCVCTHYYKGQCLGCSYSPGWPSGTPACGHTASYVVGCNKYYSACGGIYSSKRQDCR